jgi:hypothetical protein
LRVFNELNFPVLFVNTTPRFLHPSKIRRAFASLISRVFPEIPVKDVANVGNLNLFFIGTANSLKSAAFFARNSSTLAHLFGFEIHIPETGHLNWPIGHPLL